ncbi:proton-conducting transporter membrane subunit [Halomontanus rarus]|uniref:proton-conducting transporter transmembrane domain-containing protein n=1 Tax=Halomontanus rarus TaxID=3034020 RepID=UPI0023E7B732|nr:proton-conducting transporter membrane subunit [Halovivax sp. TS33]
MTEAVGGPVALLSVLVVVVPILAAVLPLAFGRLSDSVSVGVALVASAVNAVVASVLAWVTLSGGERIVTEIGGFPASQGGIELAVDGMSAVVVALIAVVGFAVAVASLDDRRQNTFYSLYLLLVAGLSGVCVTGDVFNMYVFLEISGLTAYALIASDGTGRSALAALKYLIVGTVGASLYLIGIGYAYVSTGVLNMYDLSELLADVGYADPLVLSAFAFMATGFAIKIALFPLHTWQPDAYTEAPDRVTALIAALVSTTAAYALARIVFTVFTVEFFATNPIVQQALLAIAATSVVAGSVLAVLQTRVKRMLAYSSVAQFGLVVLGIGLLEEFALVGAIIHLVGHAIIKGGLFLGVAVFAGALGATTVDDYDGLGERAPYTSAAFAVLAISLVGVPPTVGFVGKLYIAIGAVNEGAWPLVAVIVVSTVLTLGYVLRLIERMYFTSPASLEGTTPAAADGGEPPSSSASTSGSDAGSDSASGATPDLAASRHPGPAIVAVVIVAAVASLVLGFAGAGIESILEPTVNTLFD